MTSVAVDYDERALVLALRAGDQAAFAHLIDRHSPGLLRVASSYVRSRAVAEEVVQEAWLGVLRGIDRFEGRSSLKTWIFRIAINVANTRAIREARSVPFSALADEPTVDPERFADGRWQSPPTSFERLEERDAIRCLEAAIACATSGSSCCASRKAHSDQRRRRLRRTRARARASRR